MSELTDLHKTVVTTPNDLEIRTERIFDAPPELVFDCFADPELLKQWQSPNGYDTVIEEFDFRPGGKWRYLQTSPEGTEYVFFGEFLVIDRPDCLEQTFNFVMEPQPPPSIDRAEFRAEEGGRTRLVTLTTFEQKEHRDGMLQSGMEQGMDEGFVKLDALLATK